MAIRSNILVMDALCNVHGKSIVNVSIVYYENTERNHTFYFDLFQNITKALIYYD